MTKTQMALIGAIVVAALIAGDSEAAAPKELNCETATTGILKQKRRIADILAAMQSRDPNLQMDSRFKDHKVTVEEISKQIRLEMP